MQEAYPQTAAPKTSPAWGTGGTLGLQSLTTCPLPLVVSTLAVALRPLAMPQHCIRVFSGKLHHDLKLRHGYSQQAHTERASRLVSQLQA